MTLAEPTSKLRTAIGGVPVVELARQFGTPLYVYDEATIAQRVEDLRQFDVIRYAQKACSTLAVLGVPTLSPTARAVASVNESANTDSRSSIVRADGLSRSTLHRTLASSE